MLGKTEGRRRRGQQRMRWLEGITDSVDMNLERDGEGQGSLMCCTPWGREESDITWQLNNNPNFQIKRVHIKVWISGSFLFL